MSFRLGIQMQRMMMVRLEVLLTMMIQLMMMMMRVRLDDPADTDDDDDDRRVGGVPDEAEIQIHDAPNTGAAFFVQQTCVIN